MWILYNEEYWKNTLNDYLKPVETKRRPPHKPIIEEDEPEVFKKERKPLAK